MSYKCQDDTHDVVDAAEVERMNAFGNVAVVNMDGAEEGVRLKIQLRRWNRAPTDADFALLVQVANKVAAEFGMTIKRGTRGVHELLLAEAEASTS